MDLTDINNLTGYADPVEMPVSELLTGSYNFSIPSYQRGYRWESSENESDEKEVKQVDDLLNDLTSFVQNSRGESNYYLQPLMVKPRVENGVCRWDVLDGQQRLTTMLLILKCLNEKLYSNNPFPLYNLKYVSRPEVDFDRITFTPGSADYDYPFPSSNLDSFYIRKAKDRIDRWYNNELMNDPSLQDKLKELLFYPDPSRNNNSKVSLRAKFIWYNVEPLTGIGSAMNGDRLNDIEVFNRLNRGKISLTDSELIKALFLLCIKNAQSTAGSLMKPETLVRRWDEMGKKFQDEEFWKMISPKGKEYDNRMDLLFDFIKDCSGSPNSSSYRFYYDKMRHLLTKPDIHEVETLWNEVKQYFDVLCKWHENVTKHNYVGFLVETGKKLSDVYSCKDLRLEIRNYLGLSDVNEIDNLSYEDSDRSKIRNILLLFNVLTCEKFGQKFPYDLYRGTSFDIEHVNPQTDNPIVRIEEKEDWIKEHAISCLWLDRSETDAKGNFTSEASQARDLIIEGVRLLRDFRKNGYRDIGERFKPYRSKVENYYSTGNSSVPMDDKDAIGNLTLLNASINREYKNALFPKKLRVLKRSDQEGVYIPLCTKYMFLKYYSNAGSNASAFSMMRWRETDQRDYTEAIKETLRRIL